MSIVKNLTYLSSLMVLLPAMAIAGNISSMNQDETTKTFSDKTITTINAATLNREMINNKFTGFFSKDGKLVGKFANKPQNDPQQDEGTWSIKPNGSMCFKWNHWDSSQEKCISLYKLQNGILVVNEQNGFETFIQQKDIKSGNQVSQ